LPENQSHPNIAIKDDTRFPPTPAEFAKECLEELRKYEELIRTFRHLAVLGGGPRSIALQMAYDMFIRYFVDDEGKIVTHGITPEMNRLFSLAPHYTIRGTSGVVYNSFYIGDLI